MQLVCGVPPEVGPLHPSAASEVGPAWDPRGRPNRRYLDLARDRLELLLKSGLRPVVYGAWGHHIDLIGVASMARWWSAIVDRLGDLDVVWCLTGEADLWLSRPGRLGSDGSTGEEDAPPPAEPGRRGLRGRVRRRLQGVAEHRVLAPRRRSRWTQVLRELRAATSLPIVVHPTHGLGSACVNAPELLSAETAQTGHARSSEDLLWQLPYLHAQPNRPFLNLEPWYEGIRDDFWGQEQMQAFWLSMLAGAAGHAYGAQGLWNAGDGRFLAHWGQQTFDEAVDLPTPEHLGRAHALWRQLGAERGVPDVEVREGRLVRVGRRGAFGVLELCFDPERVPAGAKLFEAATARPCEGLTRGRFGTIWLGPSR